MKANNNLYTVFYAAILGIVCALLLTVVSELTRPIRLANAKAEESRNIFKALKIPYDKKASKEELEDIYNANISKKEDTQELEIFEYVKSDAKAKVLAVAIRVEGSGMWAPIKGFLALEPDMKTIRGLTFYAQEETPGLGGEIVTDSFRNRFIGKSIYDAAGQPGIVIKGGKAENPINEVDAITSATVTCGKVEKLLNAAITKFSEAK